MFDLFLQRIFWSEALHPALAAIYHNNRTVSLTNLESSNVGHDMPIEKENLMISLNVTAANFDKIDRYVHQLNFCGPVSRGVERAMLANRTRKPSKMKKIDADVKAVVDFLSAQLGATFAAARVPRAAGQGKLINPARTKGPWLSVEKMAQTNQFDGWLKKHLDTKVTWM